MNNTNQDIPLVSIILPVFKSERFLGSCLESLSSQSYKNLEIIAVVDYLGDESLKILRKHRKLDKRLKVYSNLQRYGLASTLNRCVALSKGRYIAFMDPHSISAKSRISKQVNFLSKNHKAAAVGTQTTIINENGQKIGKSEFPLENPEIYKKLISAHSLRFETAMVDRTRIPKDILKFKKNTSYPYVFAEVFMKMGQYKELANLPENLVLTRELRKSKHVLNVKKKLSFIKLLVDSTANYEYKPSFRSLFSPILR